MRANTRDNRRLRATVAVTAIALLSVAGTSLVSPQAAIASSACLDDGKPLATNGTSSVPVLIGSPQQLAQLSKDSESKNLAGYYKLTANIDLGNCAWVPIGTRVVNPSSGTTDTMYFQGTLDGGGHRITGLNVSGAVEIGLFGRVYNATVKDLFLDNVTVVSTGSAGAFAGVITGTSRLERVRATGSVSGASSVGGLIGGLIGGVGENPATPMVVDSYSLVDVTSSVLTNQTGGLVGLLQASSVDKSFSAGLVSVVAGNTFKGGLIGATAASSPVTASFYDQATSSMSDTGKGLAQTTAQMKNIDTFTAAGWAISSGWVTSNPSGTPAKIWGICTQVNEGYPFLLAEYSSDPCITNSPPDETVSTPPEIVDRELAATGIDGSLAMETKGVAALSVLAGAIIMLARRRIEVTSS